MELKEISEEVCPICGSEPVQETRKNKHTNGHWNESRTFSCGLEIYFSPNYMKCGRSKYRTCSKDPVEIAKRQKRKAAVLKIKGYIKRLDCDTSFKEALIEIVESKSLLY